MCFLLLAPEEFAQNIDFEYIMKRVLLYYVYSVPCLAAGLYKDRLRCGYHKKFIPVPV
jgi:hypothetical protein